MSLATKTALSVAKLPSAVAEATLQHAEPQFQNAEESPHFDEALSAFAWNALLFAGVPAAIAKSTLQVAEVAPIVTKVSFYSKEATSAFTEDTLHFE